MSRRIPFGAAAFVSAMLSGVAASSAAPAVAYSGPQEEDVGRYVSLGIAGVAPTWKSQHPSDEHLIYSMDTTTGTIRICGDMEGLCDAIADSKREPRGRFPHRFVGLQLVAATGKWRSAHPTDEHLIYSMDTTNGQIQVCGDMERACVFIVKGHEATVRWPKIVILYRRSDSAAIAGRIYDRLVAQYGETVFMDVYSIPFAADWRDYVKKVSLHGGIIVAIVGPNWRGADSAGHVRLDDQTDPVRVELEAALQARVPVLPVLVEGARMPRAAELPVSIRKFSDTNAATVDTGRDFFQQMSGLIRSIDGVLNE